MPRMAHSLHPDPGHALSTPLTRARLALQLLRRRGGFSAPQERLLDIALLSLDEMGDTVGALVQRAIEAAEGEGADSVAQDGEAPPRPLNDSRNGRRSHVAAINDDTVFLRLMHELLGAEEGYTVSTCFVGADGYAFVKNLQPDLVVLDLVFGNNAEEGWRTLDLLTLDPATSRIPVIVCSAAIVELDRHAEWLRRFDVEVLRKPFDLHVLLSKVRASLGVPRTGDVRTW